MANDREIAQQQMEQQERHHQDELQKHREILDNKVKVAELAALGRTSDSLNDPIGLQVIKNTSDEYIEEKKIEK